MTCSVPHTHAGALYSSKDFSGRYRQAEMDSVDFYDPFAIHCLVNFRRASRV
jgi:hypothetical protein